MQIKFAGAARNVTGSAHLITLEDGFRILLDCGLFQGDDEGDLINNSNSVQNIMNFHNPWKYCEDRNCGIRKHFAFAKTLEMIWSASLRD